MDGRVQPKRVICLALALLLLTTLVSAAEPQYAIQWWTVDGGGGTSTGGGYILGGSAGQADAGPEMSGGGYSLVGGFWEGSGEVVVLGEVIYLPLVQREAQ